MAKMTTVTIVCDLCGTEENVESHTLSIDAKAPRVVDSCPGCWSPVSDVLDNVMNAGTSKKIADRRVAAARGTRPAITSPTIEKVPVAAVAKKTTAKKATPKNTAPKRTPKKASATNTKAKKSVVARKPAAARVKKSTDTETS